MKKTIFQDSSNNNVQVSLSGGGDVRVFYNTDDENSPCLLLNEHQANILINAIQDLIEFDK